MNLSVIVHPNAKNPRTESDLLGILHIYVRQPPLVGKTNQAVIDSLAKYFGIKLNAVVLKSGGKSKNKMVEILDLDPSKIK